MHYYSIFQVPRATTFPVLCKPRKFWVLLSVSFITNRNSRNNAPSCGSKAASSIFFWELLVYEKSHMFKRAGYKETSTKTDNRVALSFATTPELAMTWQMDLRQGSRLHCFTSLFTGDSRTGIQVHWQNDLTYTA